MTLLKPTLQVRKLLIFQGGHAALNCDFHPGVNVIRGRNSSGKTTVMDLLAFSLGAESIRWKPEALLCSHTVVEVLLNQGIATLRREISDESQRPMEIFWGPLTAALEAPIQSWERYSFKRTPNLMSFSQALFNALEMPQAQGDGASNLTMHQILRVLYADQPSVHSPIFRIDQWDSALTREMISGYLAGVYDDELYSAQLRVRELEVLLSRLVSELKGIFNILGQTGNTPDLSLTNNRIGELEKRRECLTKELSGLKSGETKSGATPVNALSLLRAEFSKARHMEAIAKDELGAIELEIADSQLFIRELEARLESLSESKVTRSQLSDVAFAFCPCCLAAIDLNASKDSTCHLCKNAVDLDVRAESQILRMKNEIALQLKESVALMSKRAQRAQELKREIPLLTEQAQKLRLRYDTESRSASTQTEAAIEQLARQLGQIDEEIQQAFRLQSLSDAVARLQRQRDELTADRDRLLNLIDALEAKQETRKRRVSSAIESAMIRLLREDLPLQPEFVNAESAAINYIDNAVYVNGSKNFSESSAVVLRHIFHLALLSAGTQLEFMRVPRFVMLDGIDDGGMEKERSHRLQEIIVRECESYEVDFQLIFATSEINPALEHTELVVGRFFEPEARSLDIR
jgi:hypothetical protein